VVNRSTTGDNFLDFNDNLFTAYGYLLFGKSTVGGQQNMILLPSRYRNPAGLYRLMVTAGWGQTNNNISVCADAGESERAQLAKYVFERRGGAG
jgi:hypothetical protein